MKMESGSLGNLSNQNQKSTLEKQLDFQEAVRPEICEEYYTSVVDFIARYYITESSADRDYKTFPQEFREYIKTTPKNTILGNGAMKVAVMKVQRLEKDYKYNLENDKTLDLIRKLVKDLKQEYGLAATIEYNKDEEHDWILDSYIACLPGKVVKNEKGQWIQEEEEGATAKFFALLVERGLIDEKVISESGMATLGLKGIKFGKDFKQALAELKKKGLEKFTEKPLHEFTELHYENRKDSKEG